MWWSNHLRLDNPHQLCIHEEISLSYTAIQLELDLHKFVPSLRLSNRPLNYIQYHNYVDITNSSQFDYSLMRSLELQVDLKSYK